MQASPSFHSKWKSSLAELGKFTKMLRVSIANGNRRYLKYEAIFAVGRGGPGPTGGRDAAGRRLARRGRRLARRRAPPGAPVVSFRVRVPQRVLRRRAPGAAAVPRRLGGLGRRAPPLAPLGRRAPPSGALVPLALDGRRAAASASCSAQAALERHTGESPVTRRVPSIAFTSQRMGFIFECCRHVD